MTKQTTEALIAEAGHAILTNDYERAYHGGLVERLADALEAAEQRAAEYAAVVEKVRVFIERQSGWFRYRAEPVSTVLATAPADALREVKADVWDEGFDAYEEDHLHHAAHGWGDEDCIDKTYNPYRTREEQDRD